MNSGNIRRNEVIDCLKAIACIEVAIGHVSQLNYLYKYFLIACVWAVPIFFMIAGYYFDNDNLVVKKRVIKYIKIIGVVIIVYSLGIMIREWHYNRLDEWIAQNIDITLFYQILINNAYGAFSAGHMWFVAVLLKSTVLLFLLTKLKNDKIYIYMVALIFLLFHYYTIVNYDKFGYIINVTSLAAGLQYFFIGYILKCNENRIKSLEKVNYVLIPILALLFAWKLWCGCINYYNEILFTYYKDVTAFILMVLAIKNCNVKGITFLSKVGCFYSMDIYEWHIIVWIYVAMLFNHLGLRSFMWDNQIVPIVVLIISLVIGIILKKMNLLHFERKANELVKEK